MSSSAGGGAGQPDSGAGQPDTGGAGQPDTGGAGQPDTGGAGQPDTGGAGRGGGLLFVAVLVFVAYLGLGALAGLLRFLFAAVLLALAVALLVRVMRRR